MSTMKWPTWDTPNFDLRYIFPTSIYQFSCANFVVNQNWKDIRSSYSSLWYDRRTHCVFFKNKASCQQDSSVGKDACLETWVPSLVPTQWTREPTSASYHLTSTWTMWHRCDVRQTHKMNAENEEHFRESRKNMDDLAVKTSKKRKSWHENKK